MDLLDELIADCKAAKASARAARRTKLQGPRALKVLDALLAAGPGGPPTQPQEYALANSIAQKFDLEGWQNEARVVVLQRQICRCCTGETSSVVFDGIRRVNRRLHVEHLLPGIDDSEVLPFEIQHKSLEVQQCAACIDAQAQLPFLLLSFCDEFLSRPQQMELFS